MDEKSEVWRTVAHYLNGLAVGALLAGAVVPAVAGEVNGFVMAIAIVASLGLHGLALWVVR